MINLNLDFENLVSLAQDYMFYTQKFYRLWKKEYGGKTWRYGTNARLDAAYDSMQKYDAAMDAVRHVTGIDYKVMIDIVRVDNEYMRRTDYQYALWQSDYEKIFEVLTAPKPKTGGPYLNEYTDAAIARIEQARW